MHYCEFWRVRRARSSMGYFDWFASPLFPAWNPSPVLVAVTGVRIIFSWSFSSFIKWLQLNCFTSGSCVFWVLNFDNVAPSEELHARLRGYIINLLNIRFMQLFTQPSMAVTWVVTRSSFIEWFAGSCVYCSLQVLVLL